LNILVEEDIEATDTGKVDRLSKENSCISGDPRKVPPATSKFLTIPKQAFYQWEQGVDDESNHCQQSRVIVMAHSKFNIKEGSI